MLQILVIRRLGEHRMPVQQRRLTTLAFDGPRYVGAGLDIEALAELVAYRRLVVETAKELWRRNHPERDRLPPGFAAGVVLRLAVPDPAVASAAVERQVERPEGMLPLTLDDEVDEAADVVEEAIAAAAANRPMPNALPPSVAHLFQGFGRSLGRDDRIVLHGARRAKPVAYTAEARDRALRWQEATVLEQVTVVGELRALDLDGGHFAIRFEDGRRLRGSFDDDQEAELVEALGRHRTERLKLAGLGELAERSGDLRYLVRIDALERLGPGRRRRDPQPEAETLSLLPLFGS